MRSLVKTRNSKGFIEIQERDTPSISETDVLIKVAYVGVCGSDIHVWKNTQSWKISTPIILGHEFCGTIVKKGNKVNDFQIGDRVAVETASQVCGECTFCRNGAYNLCPKRMGYGSLADGAFSEFVSARQEILHKLPDNLSLLHAALIEPVCVALHPHMTGSSVRPGDSALVLGPGTIGILSAQILRLYNASPVVIFGKNTDARRLETAKNMGFTDVTNIELLKKIAEQCEGFNHVIDCSGSIETLDIALDLTKRNGTITKIGWGSGQPQSNLDSLVSKAVTLRGSFSHTYDTWEKAVKLVSSGSILVEDLIGGIYPLEDWQQAFEAMETGKNIKSVIRVADNAS